MLGVATTALLDDDLVTLGCDATLIHRGILESFGVSLPLHLVVEAPTLTHLAELVEQAMEDGIAPG